MVKVFRTFAVERQLQHLVSNLVIEAARDYYPKPGDADYRKRDDAPWIRRFAAAGGKVIICNDGRMMKIPHERLALVETGMIVLFFEQSWNQLRFTAKCSHTLMWWERMVTTVQHSASPAFWRIPMTWNQTGKLRKVPIEDQAALKIELQKAAQPKKAAERAKRRAQDNGGPSSMPLLEYDPEQHELVK